MTNPAGSIVPGQTETVETDTTPPSKFVTPAPEAELTAGVSPANNSSKDIAAEVTVSTSADQTDTAPEYRLPPTEKEISYRKEKSEALTFFNEAWGVPALTPELEEALLNAKAKKNKGSLTFDLANGHRLMWFQNLHDQGEVIGVSGKTFDMEDAKAIIAACKTHGWGLSEKDGIKLFGSTEAKELMWLEAQRQGLHVANFEPTLDSDVRKIWEQEKSSSSFNGATPAKNTLATDPAAKDNVTAEKPAPATVTTPASTAPQEHLDEHGRRHREDGPAYVDAKSERWYKHGLLHREDGPAFIKKNEDGTTAEESYYYEGVRMKKDAHGREVANAKKASQPMAAAISAEASAQKEHVDHAKKRVSKFIDKHQKKPKKSNYPYQRKPKETTPKPH